MGYKHGISWTINGKTSYFTAVERPLLMLKLACLNGQRPHREKLIRILCGKSAKEVEFFFIPPCCANSQFDAFSALAIEQLQHISVSNPDLAWSILKIIPLHVRACFSELAVSYYQLAADQGDAVAQNILGLKHFNGHGVCRSESKALRLLHLAADQGYADAQYNLGSFYLKRKGIRDVEEIKEGHRLLRLAADQGHPNVQFRNGCIFLNPSGEKWRIEKQTSSLTPAGNKMPGPPTKPNSAQTADNPKTNFPITTKLTKKFFLSIPAGCFLVSNCINTFSEVVTSSGQDREQQWRRIVAAGANQRLCIVRATAKDKLFP